jgi:hypothetical protein
VLRYRCLFLAIIEGDIKVGTLIIGKIIISLIEPILWTLSEETVIIRINSVDRPKEISWLAQMPAAGMRKKTLFFLLLVLLRVN